MDRKISILMGIYNCAPTLREAIDSIVAQTYDNWELILCDDGSTDDTLAIAEEYARKAPERFIILKNEQNLGLNATLNRCLAAATGDYVARMDGDDISLPQRFAVEAGFLDTHPEYALVSCPMIYFDESGIWGYGRAIEVPQLRDFVFHAPFHCHAPCMIRREAFLDVEGYTVHPLLLRYEDCDLWYKLYSKGYRGYNLQEHLYMMRDDHAAFTRRTFSSRMRAVYVQWRGFRMVRMPLRYYPYLVISFLKSLALALMPKWLYTRLHHSKTDRSKPEVTA